MTARPAPGATARRPGTFTTAHRWDAALSDCAAGLARSGLAPSTVARVCKHLRRFAAEVDTAPYDVTADLVAGWLDALDCSTPARYAYRTSLRTFYRWAHRSGRVLDDPSRDRGPHPLSRREPEGWEPALLAFRRWLRASGQSPQTADLYTYHLRRLARQTGAPDPWTLTDEDLTDWLSRQRWARETTRSARTALRTFYGWAYLLGHLDTNPAEHLPLIRSTAPVPRPASESAYALALAEAGPRERLMLRLAAEVGLRRAEVAQVHSRDLIPDDTGAPWLIVHGKGDKPRRLPLPAGLAADLADQPPGYVFPGQDRGHLSPATVGHLVSRLLPGDATMHALRHRFATNAYGIDRDVFTVQRMLGHASPNTTQRYVQTSEDTMRRLVDALANRTTTNAPRDDQRGPHA